MLDERDLSPEKKWLHEEWAKTVITNLKKRHINAVYAPKKAEALSVVLNMIPEGTTIARGDSVSIDQIGVVPELLKRGKNKVIDPFARNTEGHLLANPEQRSKMLRETFFADVFLTGTNALTMDGKLVNTDALGNRVAAMIFGPAKVIIVAGVNKIVKSVDEAMERIHEIAAPVNTRRHVLRHHAEEFSDLPCVLTGKCVDCTAEWKICCNTVIIEGNYARVRGRLHLVLVGEELGI